MSQRMSKKKMTSKRVHAASAKLFIGVLALSWLVQIDAICWPKSAGSRSGQFGSFGDHSCWNPSSPSRPAGINYIGDMRRVSTFVDDVPSNRSWAYALVGALEGQQVEFGLLESHQVVPLSAEMLIRCTPPTKPFEYVRNNGIIPRSLARSCCRCEPTKRLFKNKVVFKKFTHRNHPDFPGDTDVLLRLFVSTGPLMVGLDVNNIQGGNGEKIFDCLESQRTNHYVLLVGYDDNYFIIKNSQGTNWGSGGYGYIRRTKGCMPFAFVAY